MVCTNCGEEYCPVCDFVAEHQGMAEQKPGLCPLCLESNAYFFEELRKNSGGVANG
jgi:hypothetical protein